MSKGINCDDQHRAAATEKEQNTAGAAVFNEDRSEGVMRQPRWAQIDGVLSLSSTTRTDQ